VRVSRRRRGILHLTLPSPPPGAGREKSGCRRVINGLLRSVHSFGRESAGVAAILAATVDIGLLLFTTAELDAAVSAGAEYAVNNAPLVASNPSTLSSDIASVVDNAIGSSWATSTVNVNNSNDGSHCYCPTGTPGSWTWGSTVTCGSACTGGGVGGQFVTITASRSISPLFSTFGFVPSGTVSRSALVETE
jgi:hypothetical protein